MRRAFCAWYRTFLSKINECTDKQDSILVTPIKAMLLLAYITPKKAISTYVQSTENTSPLDFLRMKYWLHSSLQNLFLLALQNMAIVLDSYYLASCRKNYLYSDQHSCSIIVPTISFCKSNDLALSRSFWDIHEMEYDTKHLKLSLVQAFEQPSILKSEMK